MYLGTILVGFVAETAQGPKHDKAGKRGSIMH